MWLWLKASHHIYSATYFYPTTTKQILIEGRDNFFEVQGPYDLSSCFPLQTKTSPSKGICLKAFFVACVEPCCKSQSFPREVPLLENAGLWQNEAIFQVCAGVDSYSSSWGMLRDRQSSNAREDRAGGCVSAGLRASRERNGDQQ